MKHVLLASITVCSLIGISTFTALAAEPAKKGETCGGTPPILCETGLQCSGPSGVCEEKLAGEGEQCGGTPPILCQKGLQCSGPSGTCQKY
jgi:hypothetical protein